MKLIKAIKAYRQNNTSWKQRLKDLANSIFVHPTLPNIALGMCISTGLHWYYGKTQFKVFAGAIIAWLLTVLIYVIGEEITSAFEALEAQMDEDEDLKGVE